MLTSSKKIKRLTAVILAAAMLALLSSCEYLNSLTSSEESAKAEPDFNHTHYLMDDQTLREWFPEVGGMERVYWKQSGTGSGRAVGPEANTLAGFIIAEDLGIPEGEKYTDISYIEFPEGIDPFITGLSDFDWRQYPSVTKRVLGNRFIGDVYVDQGKNLIYFKVQPL